MPMEILQLEKVNGMKKIFSAEKKKHAKCAIDPQTAVCILRRSSDKNIWNPVPLYLVTTAALTLRGS